MREREPYLLIGLLVGIIAGCGMDVAGSSKDCRSIVDDGYSPWNYLAWRDSRNARFSSVNHALPCSSYVKAAPSTVPLVDAIRDCPDKNAFYGLIGRYDQFVAGWDDVRDTNTGSRVQFAEVDSAENFQSDLRLEYEACR